MRRIALQCLVAVVLAAGSGIAGGAAGDKAKLQGSWELTAVRVGGVDIPPRDHKLVLTFKGDKITSREGEKKEETSTYTLDEGKKPKHLTVAKTAREKEMKAIYQLAGDALTIGVSSKGPDADRPTSLEDKETVVLTLKRVKK